MKTDLLRLLGQGSSGAAVAVLIVAPSPAGASSAIALATPSLAALQLAASTGGEMTPEPLRLPSPGEELPPLREDSIALSSPDGPDPLLARERTRRRSTADLEPRGSSVLERKRPLYDATGIKVGGFTVFPTFTVGAGATTDAVPGDADIFGSVRAAAVARSDWSRHQLVFDGFLNHRAYATHSSEDGTSWLARARGTLDVHGRDRFTAELSNERVIESRGTIGELVGTNRPVRLTRSSAELGGHAERGRFTGQFHLEYSKLDYDSGVTDGGTSLISDRRDSDLYRGQVEVGYQFAGPRSLFLSVQRIARRYEVASSPLRDSNEIQVLAGIQGEITPLISGRLSVGHISVDFLDPRIRSRRALAVDARLTYLITELTTINLSARRATRNVASPTSPLAIVTDFRLGADHELLRNLILSASAVYQSADFEGPGSQKLVGGNFGAKWLISPRWRASFDLGAVRRSSRGLPFDRDFDAITATAGLTFQF